MTILAVEKLSVNIPGNKPISILKDISFNLQKGETLGVIGESAAGKSTLCKTIMGILPSNFHATGVLRYYGTGTARSISEWNDNNFAGLRGSEIGMVFQDSPGSLNPLFKCGAQLLDVLSEHSGTNKPQNKQDALKFLSGLGYDDGATIYNLYPHQLSGGMAQRISLALALAGQPRILIADEPTSSLDTNSKAQYLDLLQELKEKKQLSLIFVTHNLDDAIHISDSVLVIYNGCAVELQKTGDLQKAAAHPYTEALLDIHSKIKINRFPDSIPGEAPSQTININSCPFHPRCSKATAVCRKKFPEKHIFSESSFVRCHHPNNSAK